MSNQRLYDRAVIQEGGYTVEFSNRGALAKKHAFEGTEHDVDWIGRFIPPGRTRDECLRFAPKHDFYIELILRWAKQDQRRLALVDGFFYDMLKRIVGNIPDSSALQRAYLGASREEEKDYRGSGIKTPDDVIHLIIDLVDRHFPPKEFGSVLLTGKISERSKSPIKGELKDIPLRVLAAIWAIAFACEEANQGDLWYAKVYKNGKGSTRTGCVMSSGWYLYLRYTDFPVPIVRRSLQGKMRR